MLHAFTANRMNAPDRWSDISRIYHEALVLPATGRAAFLQAVCAGNTELRRELESLLDCHSAGEPFIAASAFEVMASALAAQTAARVTSIDLTRIRDVFALALERPTVERLQFLERACAMLVAEAERLIPEARMALQYQGRPRPRRAAASVLPGGDRPV